METLSTTTSPTVVLYRGKGDCSNKSGLLTGILQNDPWNIQSAYIECFINGNSHMTAGIDTRDVDLSQSEYSFTVAPSEKTIPTDTPTQTMHSSI